MILSLRPIDEADARTILAWNYEQPYEIYNASPSSIEEDMQRLLDPRNSYYAITNEQNDLIAFYCFGQDAQVPGGNYSADALDVGIGLHPDLTGQGFGLTLVTAGLEFASSIFTPSGFRVTVAAFNKRALRVWHKAGFHDVQSFRSCSDGREFVILMHEA